MDENPRVWLEWGLMVKTDSVFSVRGPWLRMEGAIQERAYLLESDNPPEETRIMFRTVSEWRNA